jgi:hypothetical protein
MASPLMPGNQSDAAVGGGPKTMSARSVRFIPAVVVSPALGATETVPKMIAKSRLAANGLSYQFQGSDV